MRELTVTTPWTASNDPKVIVDYPCHRYTDITHQPAANIPPKPNIFVARVVVDDATAAAINADPLYAVLAEREVL